MLSELWGLRGEKLEVRVVNQGNKVGYILQVNEMKAGVEARSHATQVCCVFNDVISSVL